MRSNIFSHLLANLKNYYVYMMFYISFLFWNKIFSKIHLVKSYILEKKITKKLEQNNFISKFYKFLIILMIASFLF